MNIQPYAIPGIVNVGNYKYSPARVMKIICEYFNISEDEIKATTRKRYITTARYIFFWCMMEYKKYFYLPLNDIGKFARGNHCHVLAGRKKIDDLMDVDVKVLNDVEEIQKIIES